METFSILLLAHIAGVILGVGGATVSDTQFFRTVKDRKVSEDELKLLKEVSRVIWGGFALATVTGVGLVAYNYLDTGTLSYIDSAYFQAKLILVSIIFFNGIVFHRKVLPFISGHLGEDMREEEFVEEFPLFSLTGAISIVSWWSVVVLAVINPSLPLIYILNIYLLAVAAAALLAYLTINYEIFRGKKSLTSFLRGGNDE